MSANPPSPNVPPPPRSAATVEAGLRPMAVAGRFYPADPQALRIEISRCFDQRPAREDRQDHAPSALRGLVVPHAGTVFSGTCAAAAYAMLAPLRGSAPRVAILAPSHRKAFQGIALCTHRGYQTPLGTVPIDQRAYGSVRDCAEVICDDQAHAHDHAIEVHLPFLQQILGAFSLCPIIVGTASIRAVERVLSTLSAEGVLLLVSSDLSHFLDLAAAQALDARTAAGIDCLDWRPLQDPNSACGRLPLAALLQLAGRLGWRAEALGQTTSAAANGGSDRVVGYGAWALWQPTLAQAEEELQTLIDGWGAEMGNAAWASIVHGLSHQTLLPVEETALTAGPAVLRTPGASFVTLSEDGELRGCIGSLQAWRRLELDIVDNAARAAFADPRFPPVAAHEIPNLTLSISLLTPQTPLVVGSRRELLERLQPHKDGLSLRDGNHRALFLPMVWESLPDPEAFLGHLLVKAGLPANHWSDSLEFWLFHSQCTPPSWCPFLPG